MSEEQERKIKESKRISSKDPEGYRPRDPSTRSEHPSGKRPRDPSEVEHSDQDSDRDVFFKRKKIQIGWKMIRIFLIKTR